MRHNKFILFIIKLINNNTAITSENQALNHTHRNIINEPLFLMTKKPANDEQIINFSLHALYNLWGRRPTRNKGEYDQD